MKNFIQFVNENNLSESIDPIEIIIDHLITLFDDNNIHEGNLSDSKTDNPYWMIYKKEKENVIMIGNLYYDLRSKIAEELNSIRGRILYLNDINIDIKVLPTLPSGKAFIIISLI